MYNVITMKTNIVKIGNSQGVRIPKLLLEESGLSTEVEMTIKNGKIIIASAPKHKIDEGILMSYIELAKDWDTPEEDKAWASLQ